MGRQRIGFVGLGLMGKGMATNLIADGFPLTGFDIDHMKIWRTGEPPVKGRFS